jgi:hypothetical protein
MQIVNEIEQQADVVAAAASRPCYQQQVALVHVNKLANCLQKYG